MASDNYYISNMRMLILLVLVEVMFLNIFFLVVIKY